MKGYVKNKALSWRHALKRTIGPGHKIPLDELYEQYGKKHDLEEGLQFVEWLRNVKLPDKNVWEIVYEDDNEEKITDESSVQKDKNKQTNEVTTPIVKKEREVSDIVNLSVRKAKVELKKITDIKLLKYAIKEANQLAHKDTLVRMLRKRIQELELTRR